MDGVMNGGQTPRAAGFWMPAEWDEHAGCLMAWPSRLELWGPLLAEAKAEYAGVARAIADFEPVTMACNPGQEAEIRDACGSGVQPLPVGVDDSWARDSGPIFVRDGSGRLAVVDFEFNAWGNRWHPYDQDNRLPTAIADHLGLQRFSAPMVLEGGAIMVDGEGTLVTTEQCLLNPNRNPSLSRSDMEQVLADFLGATTVVWLEDGHSTDVGPAGTDGHVDGVAHYVGPGHILLELPSDPSSPDHARALVNRSRLAAATDAAGRVFTVTELDPGSDALVSYVNSYVANGAVIVSTGGQPQDRDALDVIARLYPDREVVGVPSVVIAEGGGGVHCITQQIPTGRP